MNHVHRRYVSRPLLRILERQASKRFNFSAQPETQRRQFLHSLQRTVVKEDLSTRACPNLLTLAFWILTYTFPDAENDEGNWQLPTVNVRSSVTEGQTEQARTWNNEYASRFHFPLKLPNKVTCRHWQEQKELGPSYSEDSSWFDPSSVLR